VASVLDTITTLSESAPIQVVRPRIPFRAWLQPCPKSSVLAHQMHLARFGATHSGVVAVCRDAAKMGENRQASLTAFGVSQPLVNLH
jgi:hypothetical protein